MEQDANSGSQDLDDLARVVCQAATSAIQEEARRRILREAIRKAWILGKREERKRIQILVSAILPDDND